MNRGYSEGRLRQEQERRDAATAGQQERARENARLRDEYRRELESQRAQERAAAAPLDEELAPERARLEREWTAAHPKRSAADFMRHAWPHLRPNLVARRESDLLAQTRQELQRTGRYVL